MGEKDNQVSKIIFLTSTGKDLLQVKVKTKLKVKCVNQTKTISNNRFLTDYEIMKSESESRKVNKYAAKMCSELKSICSMSSVQQQLNCQVFYRIFCTVCSILEGVCQ